MIVKFKPKITEDKTPKKSIPRINIKKTGMNIGITGILALFIYKNPDKFGELLKKFWLWFINLDTLSLFLFLVGIIIILIIICIFFDRRDARNKFSEFVLKNPNTNKIIYNERGKECASIELHAPPIEPPKNIIPIREKKDDDNVRKRKENPT